MVKEGSGSAGSFHRLGQDVARVCSRPDWVDVLAENRYLDSLSHALQIGELWRNSDGHSTIFRNLVGDLRKLNSPLAGGFDVRLEIHNNGERSRPFDSAQPWRSWDSPAAIPESSSNPETRSLFPKYVGTRCERLRGSTSKILPFPVLAFPPARSVMYPIGLDSNCKRYFPSGASTNSG